MKNIRRIRSKPGLRYQHLEGLKLLTQLSNGRLLGGQIGSSSIKIVPSGKPLEEAELFGNFKTAASISLVVQTLANYCFSSQLGLRFDFNGGGSHTDFAPNFDYLIHVTKPMYEIFGIRMDIELTKFGLFPSGGAKGSVTFSPVKAKKIPDKLSGAPKIVVRSIASNNLKGANVAERQLQPFLSSSLNNIYTESRYVDSSSAGTSLTAWLIFDNGIVKGYSTLGKKGIKAEKVGTELLQTVIAKLKLSCIVDFYMADQLLLPLALSSKSSFYSIPKLTDHVLTNLDTINLILDDRLHVVDQEPILVMKN